MQSNRLGWRELSIGQLLEAGAIELHKDGNHGSAYPRIEEFGTEGVPFLTAKSVDDAGGIDLDGAPKLASDKASRLRVGFVKPDDVLLSHNATIGRVAIVPKFNGSLLIGTSLTSFRLNKSKLLPEYLAAFFRGQYFQDQLRAVMSLSTRSQVPITAQRSLQVIVPPLTTQRAIASTLRSFDHRIENLRQTNTTLETISQALFKSWFVDFDPVHAKAEGREAEGMDAATAALFPSEFEDSELGPIPSGWSARSLDSIANYLNGLALQKYPPESDVEFLPVIKIAQLRAGHTQGSDMASERLKPDYIVEDGDVLFSWSGSLEVEVWCGGRGALNQHLFKVTSGEVPKWFYYFATRHHLPSFRETAAHKATTMGHIQRRHLTEAKVAVPPEHVMSALSTLVSPLLEARLNNALQAKSLAAIRDTLLPRLISGKLRLPEAEAAFEDALA